MFAYFPSAADPALLLAADVSQARIMSAGACDTPLWCENCPCAFTNGIEPAKSTAEMNFRQTPRLDKCLENYPQTTLTFWSKL